MDCLENLTAHIGGIKKRLRCLSDAIWNNPELAYKEFFAVEQAVEFLKEQNFTPQTNFGDIATAFKAEYGTGKPAFAIFAEFDALPDVGHGCGHNLICASARSFRRFGNACFYFFKVFCNIFHFYHLNYLSVEKVFAAVNYLVVFRKSV